MGRIEVIARMERRRKYSAAKPYAFPLSDGAALMTGQTLFVGDGASNGRATLRLQFSGRLRQQRIVAALSSDGRFVLFRAIRHRCEHRSWVDQIG